MNNLIPVEGCIGFYRDPSNNSIINKNTSDYTEYLRNKEKLSSKNKKIERIDSEVSSLKDEVSLVKNDLNEIKGLLKDLIKKI